MTLPTYTLMLWAIALIRGLTTSTVLLGEIIYRLQQRRRPLAATLQVVRNLVLPMFAFMLFVQYVLQRPASAHICVTLPVAPHAERFVQDLQASVKEVEEMGLKGELGSAPIYGVAATLPSGPLTRVLNTFVDVGYKV